MGCVPHCSQLHNILIKALPDTSTPAGKTQDAMVRYWLSFVRTGDPNKEAAEGAPVWPQYSNMSGRSLAFAPDGAGGIAEERHYRQPQCDYWDGLTGYPDRR